LVWFGFNNQRKKLGESYQTVLKRFQGLERKLAKNPELYEDYRKFLKEYEVLGHMTRSENTSLVNGYFFPHHAILKESSTTTRLRVVFDASTKTTTGVSLNDTLLTGSVDQDLFSIITRFRLHTIVFTADIEKMYKQVFIHLPVSDDTMKKQSRGTRSIYELNIVTYGMTSAPHSVIRTLKQLSEDEAQGYPRSKSYY